MGKVDATITPLTMEEVRPILKGAYARGVGTLKFWPMAEPYLMAMVALENDYGRKIRKHNWGNVITTSDSAPYFMLRGNERHFRVLPSHSAGADHFIHTLLSKTNKRILEGAMSDDFDAFHNGIWTPNPQTHMAYCPDCEDTRHSYFGLVQDFKEEQEGPIAPTYARRSDRPQVVKAKTKPRGDDGGFMLFLLGLVGGAVIYFKGKGKKGRGGSNA